MASNKDKEFEGVVESLLSSMDTVLSAKTVVGTPTMVGDTIILPLVDVTFGVGAGSGNNNQKGTYSGAGGMGGKMTPSAVLVVRDGYTKLVNIKNQDTVTKVLDMLPDLIPEVVDKFKQPKKNQGDEMTDAEVVDIAFPEKSGEKSED